MLTEGCQALIHTAASLGADTRLLRAVEDVNKDQKAILVSKIVDRFGGQSNANRLEGLRFGLWVLASNLKQMTCERLRH